jgi:hypothetical protein
VGIHAQFDPSFARDRWIDLRRFGLLTTFFCFAIEWSQVLVGGQSRAGWLPRLDWLSLIHAGSLAAVPVCIPSGFALLAGITGSDAHAQDVARSIGFVIGLATLAALLYSIPAFALQKDNPFRNSATAASKNVIWIAYAAFQLVILVAIMFGDASADWTVQTGLGVIPVIMANILQSATILFGFGVAVATLTYSYQAALMA